MSMKQSAAVVAAAKEILGESFQEGVDIKTYVTKEQRASIIDLVTDGIVEGDVDFSDAARAKYADRKSIRGYVSGMVTNWFNKSKELNGGTKFEYKNPGSRAGMGDAQLRELKKLLTRLAAASASSEDLARVSEAIAEREATVKAAKASKVEVNGDAIPEHLRDLLSA
jgi:hypothetical protein